MCSLVLTDFCQTIGLLHCFVLFVWEKLFMVSIFSFSKQNWIPHVTFTHSGWYCCLYNDLLNRIWCVFLKKHLCLYKKINPGICPYNPSVLTTLSPSRLFSCHRIMEWVIWKGPLEVIWSNIPAQQGPLEYITQDCVQTVSLQGRKLYSLSGYPFRVLHHHHSKEDFSHVQVQLTVHHLCCLLSYCLAPQSRAWSII